MTNRSHFVVGSRSLPGNPYDGYTLCGALKQVSRLMEEPARKISWIRATTETMGLRDLKYTFSTAPWCDASLEGLHQAQPSD